MAEYIEREAVIDLITRRYENPEICTQEINGIPAADVAPVVHGRWVDNGIPDSILSGCSVCGFTCGSSSFFYCPNCGAKMDGGGDADAEKALEEGRV